MLASEEASIEIVKWWLQRRSSDEIETGDENLKSLFILFLLRNNIL